MDTVLEDDESTQPQRPDGDRRFGWLGGWCRGLSCCALEEAWADLCNTGETRRVTPGATPTVSLFTSDRERRMWLWTLAVVVAIYSTLGLARVLAEELRNRELLDAAFVWALVLSAAAVVTLAVKTKPGHAEIGVALGVATVYLMLFLRMAIPEERSHLFEYGVVAVFIYEALSERARQGRRVPSPALLAILAASLIGAFDESIQLFMPSRVFDPLDILFNLLAAVMAMAASVALGWARRRSIR